jgi:hypothetical protein
MLPLLRPPQLWRPASSTARTDRLNA